MINAINHLGLIGLIEKNRNHPEMVENPLTLGAGLIKIYPHLNSMENLMARKTKKMLAVEERFRQPLEDMLPEMVTIQGLTGTANYLGVSKATLGYWLLKFRIDVRRVALAPGDTLEVNRLNQINN